MFRLSKENKGFGAVEFSVLGTNCILFSYIVLYFKYIGYADATIGIIMAITNITTIIAQPVFGYLSDYIITIKKIIIINMLAAIVLSSLIPVLELYFTAVFILFAGISFTERPLLNIMDSYIVKLSTKRSGLDYGFVRGIGSLGYGIAAVLTGQIIGLFGFHAMFVFHGILLTFGLIAAFTVEDYPLQPKPAATKNVNFIGSIRLLLRNSSFVLCTLSAFIAFIGVGATNTYFSLLFTEVGGSSSQLGIAFLVMSSSEIPVMWNFNRITRRFSLEKLMLTGLVVYGVKLYLVTVFATPAGVICIQVLQALSYALFLPSILQYVRKVVPPELTATAITFSVSIYGGLGGVIGTFAGGFISQYMGIFTVFRLSGLCCFTGFIIFFVGLLGTGRKQKNSSSVEAREV